MIAGQRSPHPAIASPRAAAVALRRGGRLRCSGRRPGRGALAAGRAGPRRAVRGADGHPARRRRQRRALTSAAAEAAVSGKLERQLARLLPGDAAGAARRARRRRARPPRPGDEVALAAARGRALAALRRGAFDVAVAATAAGEVERARGWLLIRDFRQATRFTRPGVDATTALDQLEAGEIAAGRGRHRRPQGPARRLPGAPRHLPRRGHAGRRARLRAPPSPRTPRSPPATGRSSPPSTRSSATPQPARAADADFAALAAAAARGDSPRLSRARDAALGGPRRLHRGPLHPRGAGPPRPPADPLPRPDPGRVRPRDRATARSRSPSRSRRRSPSPRRAKSAFSDLESALQERDPAGVRTVNESARRARPHHRRRERGRRGRVRGRDRVGPRRGQRRARRDVPGGVEGVRHRGRLRPGRDQPRPDGGRGQRRRARAGRAGPAQRLRVLRVRPRAPAARPRPAADHRGRGPGLVRRRAARRASPS